MRKISEVVSQEPIIQRGCPAGHEPVVVVTWYYRARTPIVLLRQAMPKRLYRERVAARAEGNELLKERLLTNREKKYIVFLLDGKGGSRSIKEFREARYTSPDGVFKRINKFCKTKGLWLRVLKVQSPKSAVHKSEIHYALFVMTDKL